jgi:hypothetical protein
MTDTSLTHSLMMQGNQLIKEEEGGRRGGREAVCVGEVIVNTGGAGQDRVVVE